MTICTIIAAIKEAKTLDDVTALYHNASPVYEFDPEAQAELSLAAQAATYLLMHPSQPKPIDSPMPAEMVTEYVAICVQEPRGEYGMEGYQRGQSYRCQFVEGGHPRYYRIFPGEPADYYECAIPRHFCKFFAIEEKA